MYLCTGTTAPVFFQRTSGEKWVDYVLNFAVIIEDYVTPFHVEISIYNPKSEAEKKKKRNRRTNIGYFWTKSRWSAPAGQICESCSWLKGAEVIRTRAGRRRLDDLFFFTIIISKLLQKY